MNTPIKFRAYDTEAGMYLKSGLEKYISLNSDGHLVLNSNYGGLGNRVIFEQFTGLSDKNGNEVCVGDILSFDSNTIDTDKPTFIVEYRDGYQICGRGIDKWLGLFLHGHRFQHTSVLGNVNENPEMTKP